MTAQPRTPGFGVGMEFAQAPSLLLPERLSALPPLLQDHVGQPCRMRAADVAATAPLSAAAMAALPMATATVLPAPLRPADTPDGTPAEPRAALTATRPVAGVGAGVGLRRGPARARAARRLVYRNGPKRALDILLVLVSLPVTLPLMLVMALLVAIDGGRPFYSQPRVGKGGRLFRMWKLRSMEPDAEAALEGHLARDPALRAEWDSHQKLRHDPRITALGRFLRKSSLDELPQIWNVLRGDMSLVGPRPMLPEQQPLYPGQAYFRLRPGLTGLWQVSARNDSVFAYRAACDSRYDRRLSFWLDVKVILFTFIVVFRGTGQ